MPSPIVWLGWLLRLGRSGMAGLLSVRANFVFLNSATVGIYLTGSPVSGWQFPQIVGFLAEFALRCPLPT